MAALGSVSLRIPKGAHKGRYTDAPTRTLSVASCGCPWLGFAAGTEGRPQGTPLHGRPYTDVVGRVLWLPLARFRCGYRRAPTRDAATRTPLHGRCRSRLVVLARAADTEGRPQGTPLHGRPYTDVVGRLVVALGSVSLRIPKGAHKGRPYTDAPTRTPLHGRCRSRLVVALGSVSPRVPKGAHKGRPYTDVVGRVLWLPLARFRRGYRRAPTRDAPTRTLPVTSGYRSCGFTASKFSRSNDHRAGLLCTYSRIRRSESSLRMTCS